MNPDLDQLDETFAAHESLAPDAEAALAKSHEIARNLKRRQWAVRATGGAVLGAGLIVGGIAIPGALHHSGHNAVIETADGAGAPTPVSSPTSAYTEDQELDAYFDAGYDYSDAQQLAQAWNEPNADIGSVKAEAGGKLLAGEKLPVPPSGSANAGSTVVGSQGTSVSSQDAAAVQVFFDAGYTYDDAVQLAKTWNTVDPYHAKIEGGQKIEQGESLPIPPSGTPASAAQNGKTLPVTP